MEVKVMGFTHELHDWFKVYNTKEAEKAMVTA